MPPRSSETVLRVFFENSQAVVREHGLEAKLRQIAAAVVAAGLYRRAAVQLYAGAYGEKIFGCAGVTAEEEEWLRTHDVLEPEIYDRVRRIAAPLGGPVYFIAHDQMPGIVPDADTYLLAGKTDWRGPGFWHPDDMLYCELTASDGTEMGNLTADEPFDGRVPTTATAALLAPFVALAAAVLEQELGRRRDPLTGCFNGPYCRDEVNRRLGTSRPFALVFLDMDDLKDVNDRHGHAAGDEAIRGVGEALRDVVARMGGFSGRLHGDEFVVLLWTEEREADLTARLEREWRSVLPNVSWGVAVHRPDDDAQQLLRRAELAMYLDKARRKAVPGESPRLRPTAPPAYR